MLTLYTNPMSRGRMARWMLEEIGEPYTEVVLQYGADMHRPEYLALNPMGKVPTLVHDGKVVTELAAICAYLAGAFPAKHLMADDAAAFYRWLFFTAGPFEAAITNAAFGWKPAPEQEKTAGYGNLDRVIEALSAHFAQNDYVADGRFTAADIYVGGQIGFALGFGRLPKLAPFTAYWDRLKDRPAYLKAAAADDALLAPKV